MLAVCCMSRDICLSQPARVDLLKPLCVYRALSNQLHQPRRRAQMHVANLIRERDKDSGGWRITGWRGDQPAGRPASTPLPKKDKPSSAIVSWFTFLAFFYYILNNISTSSCKYCCPRQRLSPFSKPPSKFDHRPVQQHLILLSVLSTSLFST